MENVKAQNDGYLFDSIWPATMRLAFGYLTQDSPHNPSSEMMAGKTDDSRLRNELLSSSLGMSIIQE